MRFPLPRLAAAALAGALLVGPAVTPTLSQGAAFNDQQKQAIGQIVREYLVKNPEVLQEAMAELERRQNEAQQVAQAKAVKDSRDILVNSPHAIIAGNPT